MSQLRLLAAATLFIAGAVAYADHPRHHHAPPQEAIDACANAKSGDSCSFTLPARDGSGSSHAITGTCETPPKHDDEAASTTLACRPDHPPPHGDHDGPPPR